MSLQKTGAVFIAMMMDYAIIIYVIIINLQIAGDNMSKNEYEIQILALCQIINDAGKVRASVSVSKDELSVSVLALESDGVIYSGKVYMNWPELDSQFNSVMQSLRGFV